MTGRYISYDDVRKRDKHKKKKQVVKTVCYCIGGATFFYLLGLWRGTILESRKLLDMKKSIDDEIGRIEDDAISEIADCIREYGDIMLHCTDKEPITVLSEDRAINIYMKKGV